MTRAVWWQGHLKAQHSSFGIRKVLGCIRCPFSFDILMCDCGDGAGRVVELRESHIKNHTLVPERAMEQRNEADTARLEFQQAGNIRNSTSSELQLRYIYNIIYIYYIYM